MVSVEKEKNPEKSSQQLTHTLAESVNKTKSVNKMLTNSKFKSELQRVRKDQLEKLNLIANKYSRRSFPEVIDLLLFCYDFLEEISDRYRLSGVSATTDFIEKYLPKSDFEIISSGVIKLLDDLGINGRDRAVLEQEMISILKNVKIDRKSALEVLKPLLVMKRR